MNNTDHAIVLGSGIAGLSAAAALSPRFRRVTVIERDTPGVGTAARTGVPQGRHLHGLLAHGLHLLNQILPGFDQELIAKGATRAELLSEVRLSYFGSTLLQTPIGLEIALASRPFLEAHLRARVRALHNVTIHEGTEACDLVVSRRQNRVTAVRIDAANAGKAAGRGGQEVAGDLVVDALGRTGRSATWLAGQGWGRPTELKTRIEIAYASRRYHLPPQALGKDKALLIGPRPDRPRGLALAAQEDDCWVLSLYGYGEQHCPPTRPEDFDAFARGLLPRDVVDALNAATPIDEISAFHVPTTVRRLYHRQPALPDGLVAVGEAVSSVNPVYGTGMTAAIVQALKLGECLDQGEKQLPLRYYQHVAQALRWPWLFSSLADRTMPHAPGVPAPTRKALGRYFARVMSAASTDVQLATAVMKVIDMTLNPLSLLRPQYLLPVMTSGFRECSELTASPQAFGPSA